MSDSLEAPGSDGSSDWASLYRARSDEVVPYRPIFTGDVFDGVDIPDEDAKKTVILLQHPCAMRVDGVSLNSRLLVAEVLPSGPPPEPSRWATGYYKQMPLPELKPDQSNQHCQANLTKLYIVTPEMLEAATRIACLSQAGVNILLQRWVHHNSRAIVGTHLYQQVSSPQFEEADILEEWCMDREGDGISLADASHEIHEWLTDSSTAEFSPQESLKEPQYRSQVRMAMRQHLKKIRANGS